MEPLSKIEKPKADNLTSVKADETHEELDLSGLNLSDANPQCSYRPLSNATSIRVLRVSCIDRTTHEVIGQLEEIDLQQNPEYNALSYTWADPMVPKEGQSASSKSPGKRFTLIFSQNAEVLDIENQRYGQEDVQHRDVSVRNCAVGSLSLQENLSDFIQMHFESLLLDKVPLWVDAICINQEHDPKEKKSQIFLMGEIYGKASKVYVWLGKDNEDLDCYTWWHEIVVPPLKSWTSTIGSSTSLRPFKPFESTFWKDQMSLDPWKRETWESCWKIYCKFTQKRSWFQRGWILQEFALAKDLEFVCSSELYSWDNISFLAEIAFYNHISTRYIKAKSASVPINTLGAIRGSVQEVTLTWHHFWIMLLSLVRREFSTTHAEDKVYCSIGLVQTHLPASRDILDADALPSAPTVEDVYQWACKTIVTKGSLEVLAQVEDPKHRKLDALPSWVPDWSVFQELPTNIHYSAEANLPSGMRVETPTVFGTVLRVPGVLLDVVRDSSASSEPYWKTKWFWHVLELTAEIGSTYQQTGQKPIDALWRTLILDQNFTTFGGKGPCPPAWSHCFRLYAGTRLAWHMEYALRVENALEAFIEDYEVLKAKLDVFDPDLDSDSKSLLPEVEQLANAVKQIQQQSEHLGEFDRHLKASNNIIYLGADPQLHGYGKQLFDKAVFSTIGGLLGMGPESTSISDEIWQLPGFSMPVILRKVDDSDERSYRLIGATYVHGIMHGELMQSLAKENLFSLETINII
jgi:hypothetical protein